MNEIPVTVVGNVASEPSLRQLTDGVAVASFRLASTPRRFDRASGDWKDGETLWVSVSCWRALAENVCASVHKGDPVVVTGRLAMRSYDGRDGERHSVTEVEAVTIGHDLWRGTASFARSLRTAPGAAPGAGSNAGLDAGSSAGSSAEPSAEPSLGSVAASAAGSGQPAGGPGQQVDRWSIPLTSPHEQAPAA